MIIRNITFLKWQARDLLRLRGMRLLAYARLAQHFSLKLFSTHKSILYLMDAHRYYPADRLTQMFLKNREQFLVNIDRLVKNVDHHELAEVASRSIILKKPTIINRQIEKGVLLITFTESLPFYNKYVDCEQLLKYFYIVLEPSWAGYCNPNILFYLKYRPHPIIIQATEGKDYSFINSLKSNLIPVDFGASDWVDDRVFHPIQGLGKKYDAIYVCTYKPIKRHHVFFKAIRKINDPSYKAALVCVSWGGARSEVENLIDYYKVRNNITLYENCPPKQVNELLNKSKVNVLLSLKEGSNRSIFEGFFSNTPCVVLKRNIGVNKRYVNSMTGELIHENNLRETLLHFRRNWDQYKPRDWALRNISPQVTTKKLSDCLKKAAQDNNELWTRDIVPKVNVPEVKYLFHSDYQNFPDAGSVISLFLKTNIKEPEDEQIAQDSLMKLCYKPAAEVAS